MRLQLVTVITDNPIMEAHTYAVSLKWYRTGKDVEASWGLVEAADVAEAVGSFP